MSKGNGKVSAYALIFLLPQDPALQNWSSAFKTLGAGKVDSIRPSWMGTFSHYQVTARAVFVVLCLWQGVGCVAGDATESGDGMVWDAKALID
jgi:hypothetical protein